MLRPTLIALLTLALAGCGSETPSLRPDAATDAFAPVPDATPRDGAGDAPAGFDGGVDAPGDGAPSDATAEQWVEVCKVSSALNLRDGPGTSYNVITTMPLGAKLRVLGSSGSWNKVDYNGQVGWASSSYLCATQPPGGNDGGGGNDAAPGAYIGSMWITYYWLSYEADYSGSKDTTLYDKSCQPIAKVPAAYSDAVCIEGSGKLSSGTVINVDGSCSCGRPCPTGGTLCYVTLGAGYPWGLGAFGNALEPFHSIAVDKSFIALKSVIYIKEWDGVMIPKVGSIGGFVHDGCFRADDVGGGITGNHYDFFSGTRSMYQALDKLFPTKATFTAYDGGARCAYLKP